MEINLFEYVENKRVKWRVEVSYNGESDSVFTAEDESYQVVVDELTAFLNARRPLKL